MKKLAITTILLAVLTTSAQAGPSLKDCERIMQQGLRQKQIADAVRVKSYGVYGPAAQCAFGKEAMPQLERIIADKRAIRSNSCWTPNDEAWYQRLLVLQKNFVRSVAANCVVARNQPAAAVQQQAHAPSRTTLAKD